MEKIQKLALVCSSGGHLFELYSLKDYWKEFPRFWFTFKKEDSKTLLQGEKIYWAFSPTNRSIKNFVRNFIISIRILIKERPDLIISTGSGVAVSLIYCAKLFNIKAIHIESLTRVNNISMTGKLLHPVVDEHLVQWPELADKYKKAKYVGQII